MALKRSRYGEFLACTGYPTCKATKPVVTSVMDCPVASCGGTIVQRRSRRGKRSTAVQTIPAAHSRSGSVPYRKPVHSVAAYMLEKQTKKQGVTGSARRVNTKKRWRRRLATAMGTPGRPPHALPGSRLTQSSWTLLDDEHASYCRRWRRPGPGQKPPIRLLRVASPCSSHEMRPQYQTPAHQTDLLGELVCSNSLKADTLASGHGLLKAELRHLGSLILQAADASRVPAGAALAVDRTQFAQYLTTTIQNHPNITLIREEVEELPAFKCLLSRLWVHGNPCLDGVYAESAGASNCISMMPCHPLWRLIRLTRVKRFWPHAMMWGMAAII